MEIVNHPMTVGGACPRLHFTEFCANNIEKEKKAPVHLRYTVQFEFHRSICLRSKEVENACLKQNISIKRVIR